MPKIVFWHHCYPTLMSRSKVGVKGSGFKNFVFTFHLHNFFSILYFAYPSFSFAFHFNFLCRLDPHECHLLIGQYLPLWRLDPFVIVKWDQTFTGLINQPEPRSILANQQLELMGVSLTSSLLSLYCIAMVFFPVTEYYTHTYLWPPYRVYAPNHAITWLWQSISFPTHVRGQM